MGLIGDTSEISSGGNSEDEFRLRCSGPVTAGWICIVGACKTCLEHMVTGGCIGFGMVTFNCKCEGIGLAWLVLTGG